jgi:hypothetical protein
MPQVFAAINDCVKGSTAEKLTAVVDDGLPSMPPSTVGPLPQNVHNALNGACAKR